MCAFNSDNHIFTLIQTIGIIINCLNIPEVCVVGCSSLTWRCFNSENTCETYDQSHGTLLI